jgi:hypothetical protein
MSMTRLINTKIRPQAQAVAITGMRRTAPPDEEQPHAGPSTRSSRPKAMMAQLNR